MRPCEVCGSIFLIFVSLSLLFIILNRDSSKDLIPGPVPGSWRIPASRTGLAYELALAFRSGALFPPSEDNFQVEGFTFYGRMPSFARLVTSDFRPRNAWLLAGTPAMGKIMLRDVQREQSKLEAVLVVVKYFANWDYGIKSSVTVVGRSLNRETNEVEEESEILPEMSTDKSSQDGYCQKIVYFGGVDEVDIVGTILAGQSAIILIENVQVVVGPSAYDQIQDLICNK